jgi:hypothetical protein
MVLLWLQSGTSILEKKWNIWLLDVDLIQEYVLKENDMYFLQFLTRDSIRNDLFLQKYLHLGLTI